MNRTSAPKKIRLSQPIQLVPQLGHDAALVGLAFHDDPDVCAALDDTPSVQIWSFEFGETLLISPLPPGTYTKIRWLDDDQLAVYSESDGVWYLRSARESELWQPVDPDRLPVRAEADSGVLRVEIGDAPSLTREGADPIPLENAPSNTRFAVIDPLERYALLATEESLHVYDAESGEELSSQSVEATLTGLAIEPGGAYAVFCDAEGRVMRYDPMREAMPRLLRRLHRAPLSAIAVGPEDAFGAIAVGDEQGHLHLIEPEDGARAMTTARRVPGFFLELLLAEEIAYVGLRPHAISAYLETEDRVIPAAPLPGLATAACCEYGDTGLLVGLEDGRVVRFDLRASTVVEIAALEQPVRALAAADEGVLALTREALVYFDEDDTRRISRDDLDAIQRVAVSHDGRYAATFAPNQLIITEGKGKTKTVAEIDAFTGVQAMAFTSYRSKPTLVLVDDANVLWRLALPKAQLRRIGLLERRDLSTPIARVIDLAVDDDGFLRALCVTDNEHRLLLGVDIATSQAETLLAVIPIGAHIVAVYEESKVWLRQEEEPTLRVVRGLRPFTVEDWLRLPE